MNKFQKIYKFNKVKFLIVIILIIFALISTLQLDFFTSADDGVSEDLSISVNELLNDLDLSSIEELVSDIENYNLFDKDIKSTISKLLNGSYFTDYSSFFTAIMSLFFDSIIDFLPMAFTIIAIGILSSLIVNFKSSNNTQEITQFICFSVLILIILVIFKDILSITNSTINMLLNQMQIIFPILITLLSTIGSISTISVFNPLIAVLTTIVSLVFDKILYPIFIVILLFTIINSLTNTLKLEKLTKFLTSSFKWVIGIVFTLFTSFLSIQGISAGKFDSVSIKATKFAIKSYIPIIGGYVSDGMDFLVLGSVLIKNSIGLIGVFIVFATIISPLITIILIKLILQFCSGILEMSGNTKMSNFLSDFCNVLILPIVIIVGIAFMYIITVCLIMCTANIF